VTRRLSPGTLGALLRHPTKLPRALGAAMSLAPRGWWRRPPFLPVPDPGYWRFRMETANGGDGDVPPSPEEVLEVVDWFHRMRNQRG
jgi:hypothetical protein